MARFGAKRPQQIRDTLPIVLIVCDDAKTAPAYFAEVRTRLRKYCTVKLMSEPRDPARVIAFACNQKNELSDGGEGATVWAIIDLEMKPTSDALTASLREQAENCGVELLLSQPCFEVWVLSHFMCTGQMFVTCDAVLQEVKKQWKAAFGQEFPQKKAQANYCKLMDRLDSAISNAKVHTSAQSQSWTEVWRLLEHVLWFEAH